MAAAPKKITRETLTAQLTDLAENSRAYVMSLADGADFVSLLIAYYSLKTKYDALDDARKILYELVDNMNKQIIPAKFLVIGSDKIQVPEIKKSFYPLTKYSASILEGKKPDAYEWLRKQDLGEIITETVNAGTLANTLKEFITEKNIDPPEDLFKLTSYQTTGMSSYNPKSK